MSAPASEDIGFVPTVPGHVVFAAGERIAVEVTCPYCESVHQHLVSDVWGGAPGRKKAQRPEKGIVFDAPCGWGKYRVERETGEPQE